MERLVVKILGNGGCINNGLPYNAFLINGHFLSETPPDVMVSLQKLGIDFEKIDTIFISHLHGDHTFGMPFFIINKWVNSLKGIKASPLTVLGPEGTEEHIKKITSAAFTTSHPSYAWLEQNIRYKIIGRDFQMTWSNLSLSCFELQHLVETYGLLLRRGEEHVFAYIADTSWCPQVEQVLAGKPKIVLIDMNGGRGNVHVSLEEVIEKGVPITGRGTVYYGIHLAGEFDSAFDGVNCAKQGDEIEINYA